MTVRARDTYLSFAVGILFGGISSSAHALTNSYTVGDFFSSVSGAYTVDFGDSGVDNNSFASLSLPNGSVDGVSYSYQGGALYNYSSGRNFGGISARPAGSAENYWSIGIRPAEHAGPGVVNFGSGVDYYGFLWGTPDAGAWNTVSFYDGDQLLGSFDGSVVQFPTGGHHPNSAYFNVYADAGESITQVRFTANGNAFETDNHAFAVTAPVPEPEIYAMMAAGMSVMVWAARRKKRKLAF
jgi:hypothetical protein